MHIILESGLVADGNRKTLSCDWLPTQHSNTFLSSINPIWLYAALMKWQITPKAVKMHITGISQQSISDLNFFFFYHYLTLVLQKLLHPTWKDNSNPCRGNGDSKVPQNTNSPFPPILSGYNSQHGQKIFLYFTPSTLALDPTQPPIQRVSGILSKEVVWPMYNADS